MITPRFGAYLGLTPRRYQSGTMEQPSADSAVRGTDNDATVRLRYEQMTWMFQSSGMAFILLAFATASARAQLMQIDSSVPIFCRDASGTFQPFQRTDYGRLQESFKRQFGWGHTLRGTSPTMGVLEFGTDEGVRPRERIYYNIQPYNGGIALLHMHVRINGKVEDLTGSKMCLQTFGIVNVQ